MQALLTIRCRMKKKLLLLTCLAVILIVGAIIGAVLHQRYLDALEELENQRIVREAELTASELYRVEQMQTIFFATDNIEIKHSLLTDMTNFQIQSSDGYEDVRTAIDTALPLMQTMYDEELAFLQYVEYLIDLLNNSPDHFASILSREGKLTYFREVNALFEEFQSGVGRIREIEEVYLAFKYNINIMYNWFVYDYDNALNQIRQHASEPPAQGMAQGQATELIDELRTLLMSVTAEHVLTPYYVEEITERINILFSDIANSVERQPPLVSWTRRNTGEILIEGDEQFVRRIEDALAIIRQHPDYYEMVTTYVDKIRPGEYWPEASYMNVWEPVPTVGIGRRVFAGSLTFIAGVIVHEAYHSKLFWEYTNTNDNRIPDDDVWASGIGHMIVYEVERDFLVETGASADLLANVDRRADNAWNRYPQLRSMQRPERFRTASDEQPLRTLLLWN